MAEVGRIQIEVDARQVDKTVKSLKEMGFAAQNASGKVSKYEKETKQATRSTNKMSKASRSLTRTLGFLGVGLGGLTFVGIARSIEQATTQLNNIEATMQVAAGSSQAAGEQIAFIREESERLGLFFPTVAKQMAQFSAAARSSSITGDELKMIFTGISEASRAMGLTAPETEGAMKALQQMMSKGKVSAEELRQQLGERMPGSIQIMAQALGVGTEKLFEMMEQGKLLADEVLPKFGREMSDVFGAAADVQANKIAAAIQRLRTSFFDLMAQDSLTGATDAIDELANIIGSDSFQKHFDNIVQMVSRLGTVIANNIDVIAALGVSLSGLALSKVIQLFAGLAKSIGVSAAAARTAIPALGGLAVALNSVKRSLLLMAGPAGAIVAIVAGFTTFRNASEETRLENSFLKLSLEEIDERMKNIKDSANEAGIATLQAMQKSAQPGFEQFKRDSLAIAEVQRRIAELGPEVEAAIESTGRSIFNVPGGKELNRLRGQLRQLIAARDEFADDAEAFSALGVAIDETTEKMARLEDSAINTEEEFKDLQDSARDLMEDLFPERRALREYLDGLALIDSALEQGIMKTREAAMAREELNRRFQEDTAPDFDDPRAEVGREERIRADLLDKVQGATVGAIEKTSALDRAMQDVGESLQDIAKTMTDDVSDGLTDIIMQAESASDVFAGLARQIARTLVQQQIADPLAGEITGFASSIAGSIFGTGATATPHGVGPGGMKQNANGGNVFGGVPSIVGERGPELFVPGQDGRIIPNTEMGGGGDVTVNVINQGGEQLEAQQQQTRRGPNGDTIVDVMVKKSMERLDSQGQLDGIFNRHGARRQGQF